MDRRPYTVEDYRRDRAYRERHADDERPVTIVLSAATARAVLDVLEAAPRGVELYPAVIALERELGR